MNRMASYLSGLHGAENREAVCYPSLYEVNTRVWLGNLSRQAGQPITLADVDDTTLDQFADRGFDWIWLLSVWQTGAASRAVSRSIPAWRAEFQAVLSDLTEEDISGSGFAVSAYEVDPALGGQAALAASDRLPGAVQVHSVQV